MGTYEKDLAKIVAGRQELANAEKLLDLPITVYPDVISMQRDMEGLRQIYRVYKTQQVGRGFKLEHSTHRSVRSLSSVHPLIF